MSLQKLGKPDSPPVIVNGVLATSLIVKGKAEGLPDFDLQKLVERADEVQRARAPTDGGS